MSVVDYQDVWKTGSRVYVIEAAGGPLLDLGTIGVVSPKTAVETSELIDTDGGIKRTIIKEISAFSESYDVTLYNLNMRNLKYLFYAEDSSTYTQTTNAQTTTLPVWPGEKGKIIGSDGKYVYNLSAVSSVKNSAGSTLVAGSTGDYTVDLARGIINFVNSNVTVGASTVGNAGTVAFVPNAVAGQRVMYPQSKVGIWQGQIIVAWGRGNFKEQSYREFTGQITPGAAAFSDSQYSNFPLTIETLADPNNPSQPAGRLLYAQGAVPKTITQQY